MLILGEIVGWEFLLVIAIVVLLFGSSKIPQLARSLGQASKEFRKGVDGDSAEHATAQRSDPTEVAPTAHSKPDDKT